MNKTHLDTDDKVRESLPEVNEILNDDLRRSVIEIWGQAWSSSAWAELTDCPKGLDLQNHSLVTHSRTVARLASGMCDVLAEQNGLAIDRDQVLAIALLHDVSKLHEFERANGVMVRSDVGRKTQHGFFAAFWMHEAGLPLDMVHAVIAHTNLSSVVPQTQEAALVHYADFADSDSLLLQAGLPLFCKRP